MSLLNFRDVVAERAACLVPLGFTERQSRFLTTVMAHSGVFLERQCCRFAGIAHGQKSHDFVDRLVQRGFARVEAPGHRYQGRFYHLHHKRLYGLIGQTDNRNRKRAHRSRMIERLMLLDIVLDDRDVLWLGTESDKTRQASTSAAPSAGCSRSNCRTWHLAAALRRRCACSPTSCRSVSTR
ncbi:MAG: hypothetical protein R2708_08890 [Vicinamibacterales bacterium]